MPKPGTERALSLLGMARRAGVLSIGQDRVLGAMRGSRQLVVVADDCTPGLLRKMAGLSARHGSVCYILEGTAREALGRASGVSIAQVASLPFESGFANKLTELLQQGGRCLDEQNKGV